MSNHSPSAPSSVMARAADSTAPWRGTSPDRRFECLRRYADHLRDHRDEFADLISAETRKLRWDAAGEVGASIAKVEATIAALTERRDRTEIPGQDPRRVIRYAPIGVGVVIGPFNFPLHLPGAHFLPLLAAGNCVVFKPSEKADAVGRRLAEALRSAGLPDGVFQCVAGDGRVAQTLIEHPATGGVFFTGSRKVGVAIHRRLAGRTGVTLALEMGGNNPIVVLPETDPTRGADVVSHSAFLSSGQRCTCARRVVYVGDAAPAGVELLQRRTAQLDPGVDYGPLVDADAAAVVRAQRERLIEIGCRPLTDDPVNESDPALVTPQILSADGLDDSAIAEIGVLEWFGPLCVVFHADDFDDALRIAKATPYGLSAALLGGEESDFETFANQVGAGIVNWNTGTVGAAGVMPFGGRGDSGNHHPAGYFAIDDCNEPISSLQFPDLDRGDPWVAGR